MRQGTKKISSILPSKKFGIRLLIVLCIVGVGISITFVIKNKKNKVVTTNRNNITIGDNTTLASLLERDTDDDGLADWEEALWGTNPKNQYSKEGIRDDIYVERRRMEITGGVPPPTKEQTETDKFAKQLFASLIALKQTGQYDKDTIDGLALNLAGQITSQQLPIVYNLENIKVTVASDKNELATYYKKIQELFEKHKEEGLGNEIDVFFGTETIEDKVQNSRTISDAYRKFSEEIIKVVAPSQVAPLQLDIANKSFAMSIAVKNMLQIEADPLVGFVGFSQYQLISEEFIRAAEKLRKYMVQNDIISDYKYDQLPTNSLEPETDAYEQLLINENL
jgi:hypothetical protein